MRTKTKFSLLFSGIVFSSLSLLSTTNVFADKSIHHVSSETCKTCHTDIYKQWKGSMHANSTAFKDPIHGTFYRKVVGDPGQEGVKTKKGKYPVCLQCHAPNAAKDKKTKLDSNVAYAEGVNCVACHTLKKYTGIDATKGKLGMKAYQISDVLQGTGRHSNTKLQKLASAGDAFGFGGGDEDQKPNPHLGQAVTIDGKTIQALPMESNPTQLRTSDACMGCHDKRNNSHGVPLCATGDEYIASNAQVDCLSCHMPTNDNVADHSMGGGHDVGMLARSVLFSMDSKKKGNNIMSTVTIQNKQPHTMPTGAPFRNIYIKVSAYDRSGNVVWQNAKGHPAKEDRKAFMLLTLVDDAGKPTGPPTAKGQGTDTRLKAFEKRDLEYSIPAKGVELVRAELYYNLLWPGLVKKFTKLPKDVTAPKMIASAENSL